MSSGLPPEMPPRVPPRKYKRPKPSQYHRDYGKRHQALRKELLASKPICQRCESAWAVHAHHLRYPALSLADYEALCEPCHQAQHKKPGQTPS